MIWLCKTNSPISLSTVIQIDIVSFKRRRRTVWSKVFYLFIKISIPLKGYIPGEKMDFKFNTDRVN